MIRPGRDLAALAEEHPRIAAVWALELFVVTVAGLVTGDGRVGPYVTVILVVSAITAAVHRRVRFSAGVLGCLVLLAGLHLMGGLLPDVSGEVRDGVLYDTWIVHQVLRYDQVVHFFGSAAATWASWQVLGAWLDLSRTPAATQAVWAALAGLGKGALNEVFEFVSTLTMTDTHVGDGLNTEWDLVFDLLGCVAAGVFLVRARVARRTAGSDADRLLDDVGLVRLD